MGEGQSWRQWWWELVEILRISSGDDDDDGVVTRAGDEANNKTRVWHFLLGDKSECSKRTPTKAKRKVCRWWYVCVGSNKTRRRRRRGKKQKERGKREKRRCRASEQEAERQRERAARLRGVVHEQLFVCVFPFSFFSLCVGVTNAEKRGTMQHTTNVAQTQRSSCGRLGTPMVGVG